MPSDMHEINVLKSIAHISVLYIARKNINALTFQTLENNHALGEAIYILVSQKIRHPLHTSNNYKFR